MGHWKGGWSAVESQTQNEQQHNKNANSATTTPCLHALFICFADRCAACADFFSLVASLEESFCLPSPQDNKTQFGVNKPPRTGRQTHTHTHTRRHTHTHTATQKRECVSGYVCVRANTMHALCLHGLKFRLERPEFLGRCIHLLLQSSITRTHHCLGHAHAHAHTHARTHTHAHARTRARTPTRPPLAFHNKATKPSRQQPHFCLTMVTLSFALSTRTAASSPSSPLSTASSSGSPLVNSSPPTDATLRFRLPAVRGRRAALAAAAPPRAPRDAVVRGRPGAV